MRARAGEGSPKPGPCGVSGEARERGSEPFTHRAQRLLGVLVPRHVCGPLWLLLPLKPDAAADPAGLGLSRDVLPCQLLASLTYIGRESRAISLELVETSRPELLLGSCRWFASCPGPLGFARRARGAHASASSEFRRRLPVRFRFSLSPFLIFGFGT